MQTFDFQKLITEKLNVDPKSVTVTGFSSGGAQAMHFHLSHSSKIIGAGIFSGGKFQLLKILLWVS